MLRYLSTRLLHGLVVVMAMSIIVFAGVYAIGNPIDVLISEDATQEEIDAAKARFGLDQPLWTQYGLFLLRAAQGDFGQSFVFHKPAFELILSRFPATLELAVFAMLIAIVIGLPLGVMAGLRPNSRLGKTIMAGSIVGFSLPNFWVGLLMIMFFSVTLGVLPANGRGTTAGLFGIEFSFLTIDGLRHMLMPAITLALFKLSLVIRLARAGTREVMMQDYINFAYAKGLSYRRIVRVHLLRNILIPIVTVLGLEFGSVIAFTAVTETVFAWPGMGRLLIESIYNLDRPVIVCYLMFTVMLFLVINLIVDFMYVFLDPRVRLTKTGS